MNVPPPIQTAPLFPVLHQKLIGLLRQLSADEWQRETICAGWSVKDVASHLLDTSLRTIALYRDAYASPDKPAIQSYRDLVDYLNQLNNDWVRATRRISPAVLIDWLDQSGREADALMMALPPDEPAVFSVAWAGQDLSPNWFHVAREYTERWHHQQQIRLAVGQTNPLETNELYHPVLDTFMQALPFAYRTTPAPTGTLLQVSVPDLTAGDWFLRREEDGWKLITNKEPATDKHARPDTLVRIDRPFAWQLLTRNLPVSVVLSHVQITGDEALGHPLLAMRSVMM